MDLGSSQRLSTTDALAQLSFVVRGMVDQRAAEAGLTAVQGRLLGILRDRRLTMGELARFLNLDKSSVSGLVDRAEKRGLVERGPHAHDQRVTTVSITALGRDLIAQAAIRTEDDLSELVACLGTDRTEALTDLLTTVLSENARRAGVDLFSGLTPPR